MRPCCGKHISILKASPPSGGEALEPSQYWLCGRGVPATSSCPGVGRTALAEDRGPGTRR